MGLKYYGDMKDRPLYDLLRQAIIDTKKKLTAFSDYSQKYFPDTGISTGAYIIFDQGGTIDHVTMFQDHLINKVQKVSKLQNALQ